MAFDGLSGLPVSVRPHLLAGEQALVWKAVMVAFGDDRTGQAEPVRPIEGVDLNPLSLVDGSGPVRWESGLTDRLVGGISLRGPAGSLAPTLGRAIDRSRTARVAVTTHRILLFDEGNMSVEKDATTGASVLNSEVDKVWEAPRSAVRSARRRSRPFMVGRLVIEFADTSSIALLCGILSPIAANRIRDALAGGA